MNNKKTRFFANDNDDDYRLSLFASFSKPKLMNGLNYISSSIQIRPHINLEKADFAKIAHRLVQYKEQQVQVFTILNNVNSESDKIYCGPSDAPVLLLYYMSKDIFFSEKFMKGFLSNLESDTLTYFHFEGQSWFEILNEFRKHNIVITGGSTVKRHMLSVIQFKLAFLLLVLDGLSFAKVRKSFLLTPEKNWRVGEDFTLKKH